MPRLVAILAFVATAAWLLAPPGRAYGQNPAGWGAIKGQIVYNGDPPPRGPLNVTKDQKHCLANGPILDPTWVVDPKTRSVRDVYVWLETADGGPPPIKPELKAPDK